MAGRVEVYVHSDTITQNKGAAVVSVTCQTDFAAKTDTFILFCKRVAMLAYATGVTCWDEFEQTEFWSELYERLTFLTEQLGEKVEVDTIVTVVLE